MSLPTPASSQPPQAMLGTAFSRAAGASLSQGNQVRPLIDAREHFQAWLAAIQSARVSVALENYIIRDDEIGQAFLGALVERAQAGVRVLVIADWLGCLGASGRRFWRPLQLAGGQLRIYNPPQWGKALQWLSRDHRKLLIVDGELGFLSGVCISAQWLGDPARQIAPWRDTGVSVRGPAVQAMLRAFSQSWLRAGGALPPELAAGLLDSAEPAAAGDMAVRLIVTQPATDAMFRVDQLVAAIARRSLWITDAYFVGVAPYVQALAAAARDGVDVRLLVPGSSDIPAVASLSRAGYRPLLKAGVRVFEWNGSMLHAKTAVADQQWARVGSSNLNIASWLNNQEIDLAVEDPGFARQMAAQYLRDLEQSTEIVLARRRHREQVLPQPGQASTAHPTKSGSSGRAAASAIRLAHRVGAVITDQRVLDDRSALPVLLGIAGLLLLAALAIMRPALLAWPCAGLALWLALNLGIALARRRR